ncbi:UDP-glucose dehydrogenase family protein [Paenibacillus vandeheii]
MLCSVIGTGYVGLVSGVCFAEMGNNVICVDTDSEKIQKLNNGIMPIYEEGLAELCYKNMKNKRITFTTNMKYAVENSDVIFIAVGTPSLTNGDVDLSQVENVAKEIGRYIDGYKVIVNKSTVPIGTHKYVTKIIKERSLGKYDFDVVSNPEFLREGSALKDTFYAERVVIGSSSEKATQIITKLHEPFNSEILVTDPESAEIIKYAANAFLATKISFINEIGNFCEKVGADVEKVAKGIGLDTRISPHFLNAGIGYGGACFPKDTRAIVNTAEKTGHSLEIIKSAIKVNEKQKYKVVEKLKLALNDLKGKKIGVLGLSFKPNTDDIREAPSIDIIKSILNEGAHVKAYDPIAMEMARGLLPDIYYGGNLYDAVRDVDAVMLVTEWKEFKEMDLKEIKNLVSGNVFIDGRNIYDYEEMKKLGFRYYCIGRKDESYFSKRTNQNIEKTIT